jgi:uncharacterized protein YndB with AHSA1/START domain
MARQRIEHRATTSADPATVYALLRDGAGWPQWSPIESFELERQGPDEPEGVGAVRVFRGGRVTGRDEIAELVPERRFAYRHTSNLPLRDYLGVVELEPAADGGTAIRWVSTFRPKVPGTGALLRRALDGFVRRLAHGLAEHAAAHGSARVPRVPVAEARLVETEAGIRPDGDAGRGGVYPPSAAAAAYGAAVESETRDSRVAYDGWPPVTAGRYPWPPRR